MTQTIFKKKEAAEFLGISSRTLDTLVFRKAIPFFRVGSQLRFRLRDLEAWITSKTVKDETKKLA